MTNDFSNWASADQPDKIDVDFPWRMVRQKPPKPIKIACISSSHFGIPTHFWMKRTTPHLKENCPACHDGRKPRWYGYVLAHLFPTRENVVFEFTEFAARFMLEVEKEHGSIRGHVFTAVRPGGRENSALHLIHDDKRARPSELSPEVDIRPILAHIWGYRSAAPIAAVEQVLETETEAYGASTKPAHQRVSPDDVVLDAMGEIRGRINEIGLLPPDLILPTVNGRKQH